MYLTLLKNKFKYSFLRSSINISSRNDSNIFLNSTSEFWSYPYELYKVLSYCAIVESYIVSLICIVPFSIPIILYDSVQSNDSLSLSLLTKIHLPLFPYLTLIISPTLGFNSIKSGKISTECVTAVNWL